MARANSVPALAGAVIFSAALAFSPVVSAQDKQRQHLALTITINGSPYAATLDDTPPARDFASLLPLDLLLRDYHGIEKVADLPRDLDTSGAPASYEPRAGDITVFAPWGNIAIFYKPFRASPGLVRLGAFDQLPEALGGAGDLTVRIERAR